MDDSRLQAEAQAKASGWLAAYLDLKAHGLTWQKAAFCAWFSAPKLTRQPKTQDELAELLNYKSSWVFHRWKKQSWFRELGIDRLRESILLQHLADVDRKTIESALTGSVADRRLYYEQVREARPDVAEDEGVLIWLKTLRESGSSDEMADDVPEGE